MRYALDALTAGDRIDIVTLAHSDGVRVDFERVSVTCRSVRATRESALEAAVRLECDLAAVLRTLGGSYWFLPVAPVEMSADTTELSWSAEAVYVGVGIPCVAGRRVGFLVPSPGIDRYSSVLLDPVVPGFQAAFLDSVLAHVSGDVGPMALHTGFEAFELSPVETEAVAGALRWLCDGGSKEVAFGLRRDGVVDAQLLAGVRFALETWLKSGRGLRRTATLRCRQMVPSVSLAMIERDVFGSTPVIWRQVSGPDDQRDYVLTPVERALDLRGCLNTEHALPPFLPSPAALAGCGARKFYASGRTDVAPSGLRLGHLDDWIGSQVRFPHADRSRHCYVAGATGTGKSSLLHNMIAEDMARGAGVCVIDPHGDLCEQLLDVVPPHRINDVVYVNPSDTSRAVGINFLEVPDGAGRGARVNYVVNEMLGVFDRLYDLDRTGGPIFEQYMRNTMLLLLENEYRGATLLDVPAVFEDASFRASLKDTCTNPIVRSFWSRMAERANGEASLANFAPYVTSKLNQFTTNGLLRPIIGQKQSTIDFRDAMDRSRILIVNLCKGLLGSLDSRLLGMLVLGKLFGAAMERVELPASERAPFYVYIDEFQSIATDSIAHMIAESRKYGLCLTLANQNLAQLASSGARANLLDAVLGNVGSLLLFRLGPVDAARMEVFTAPTIDAADLVDLPDFHAVARMLIGNRPSLPFVFRTDPVPAGEPGWNSRSSIEQRSMAYTRSTGDIEREIRDRHDSHATAESS
jgi:hypothetical protein